MRLFVALDLPEAVKEELRLISCGLPGARWELPEQLHLTLRFIGDVDGEMLKNIRVALAAVRCLPFSLQLLGIGFFPPRQESYILWVGVKQSKPLLRLHRQIESTLKKIGIEPEKWKFTPHITLARLHGSPADMISSFL
jgi:2'-5' RNA ligase